MALSATFIKERIVSMTDLLFLFSCLGVIVFFLAVYFIANELFAILLGNKKRGMNDKRK